MLLGLSVAVNRGFDFHQFSAHRQKNQKKQPVGAEARAREPQNSESFTNQGAAQRSATVTAPAPGKPTGAIRQLPSARTI